MTLDEAMSAVQSAEQTMASTTAQLTSAQAAADEANGELLKAQSAASGAKDSFNSALDTLILAAQASKL